MPEKTAISAHIMTGKHGEDYAASYLKAQGIAVVDRNWRPSEGHNVHLELDIIAREAGGELIFVEVKTRSYSPGTDFSPVDAFGKTKQGRLLRAASLYLGEKDLWNQPCRFDLITLIINPDKTCTLEHFKDVISFPSPGRGAMGGSHTPWQPW